MNARAIQQRLAERGFDPGAIDGQLGPRSYAALFRFMGATTHAGVLGRDAAELFPLYDLTTPLRIAHWLGQFGHETLGFQKFEESLSYTSAQRIMAVWPSRFPTLASAQPFVRNPQALAERVYGGRMGNVNPGDGWKYRGRSACHLTGGENYLAASVWSGLPLYDNPDLAADPENAVLIACAYWKHRGLNRLADRDDLVAVTRTINGGSNGLADRRARTIRAKRILV